MLRAFLRKNGRAFTARLFFAPTPHRACKTAGLPAFDKSKKSHEFPAIKSRPCRTGARLRRILSCAAAYWRYAIKFH
ncbi:MAG: hypothetical protein DBY30_06440 [Verrucomicrobia bacterium]|nr:MAG: hypothetical protein DBY30_06440 [Verrucomicrobiota bacterium]